MNRVTFFGAFTLALSLAVANFGYQWLQDVPNWYSAAERTWFQALAILTAWFVWREPGEKTYRRGQGPGWCD